MTAITFHEACRSSEVFGPWLGGDSWHVWHVLQKAIFGEPLDESEQTIFRTLTDRDYVPGEPVTEIWIIAGRRSGKDVNAAALVAYLASFGAERLGFLDRLSPGEKAVVQLLAVDRDQARVCLSYLTAMFEQPVLADLVVRMTADGVDLANGLSIEVVTNDQRRVRGRTVVAAVLDEVAFWGGDTSARPDKEVYRAIRPSMATVPGAMLIGISSPYAKRGLLFEKFKKHYGKSGRRLVVKAPTWVMNPTLPRDGDYITEEFEDDPVSAAAEYGAEFRTDVEQFVPLEVVEACIEDGVLERAWKPNTQYRAFCDPAGGSGKDSMTLAIAHREKDRVVLDALREVRPPFSPASVVEEFSMLLVSYGLRKVSGDHYGAQWVEDAFKEHRVTYEHTDLNRSQIYLNFLPVLNSGRADLLDNDRLIGQIVGLERRSGRGGRDTIDHAPNSHDDIANAAAGVLVELGTRRSTFTLDNIY